MYPKFKRIKISKGKIKKIIKKDSTYTYRYLCSFQIRKASSGVPRKSSNKTSGRAIGSSSANLEFGFLRRVENNGQGKEREPRSDKEGNWSNVEKMNMEQLRFWVKPRDYMGNMIVPPL